MLSVSTGMVTASSQSSTIVRVLPIGGIFHELISRFQVSNVQEGKRYVAEIDLSHFYEIDHYKNKLGKISVFMQDQS